MERRFKYETKSPKVLIEWRGMARNFNDACVKALKNSNGLRLSFELVRMRLIFISLNQCTEVEILVDLQKSYCTISVHNDRPKNFGLGSCFSTWLLGMRFLYVL